MRLSDDIGFLFQYVCKPRTTGALWPSSRYLARRMAANAGTGGDVVVELGAGTGAVTEELIKPEFLGSRKLYSIEYNPDFCAILRKNFPKAKVINGSAENIRELLKDDSGKISAIVSSLPLLSLPSGMVANIISEIEASLRSGGRFVQFTYKLNRDPKKLGFKNMEYIRKSIVLLNIPPARVDVFEKR